VCRNCVGDAEMALVRCATCGVKPAASDRYARHVPPFGGEKTALVCGTPSCERPGLIWLEAHEAGAYDHGQRIFRLNTNTTKVRAQ
jgi:hypothetical protein